jgi:nucleotide-binding universal stress UspA family protein
MAPRTNDTQETGDLGVVVGADGSRIGLEAVRWAAAEAQLRGLPLRILHAAPYTRAHTGSALHRANDILGRAFTLAHRAQPQLPITTRRTEDDPARSLLDASTRARLLVVGMGGGQRMLEALITSVALDVTAHAACPVAVILGERAHAGGHDVIVGVDAPETDVAALEVAFADARRHGDGVVVVHSRHRTGPHHGHAGARDDHDRAVAVSRLGADLVPWTSRYPDVPLRVHVVTGAPAGTLLTAAITARLLVVGTHGRGATARVVLGSTSRQVLRRCPVPVIVVDPGVTPEPGERAEPQPSDIHEAGRREPHDRIELR